MVEELSLIIKHGYELLEKREYQEALEKFMEGLADNPNELRLFIGLAESFLHLENIQEAKFYAELAEKTYKHHPSVVNISCKIMLIENDIEKMYESSYFYHLTKFYDERYYYETVSLFDNFKPSYNSKNYPDFLCVGAENAGTDWIYENLSAHPDLELPKNRKELHFFDSPFYKNHQLYTYAFRNFTKKCGEVTSSYAAMDLSRINEVKRFNKNIKIIFILKDPVLRAWDDLNTNKDLEKLTDTEIKDYLTSPDCTAKSDMLSCLKNWTSVFDEKQLFILFYKDIISRPKEVLAELFDFLSVPIPQSWERFTSAGIIPTRAKEIPKEYDKYLLDVHREQLAELYKIFGSKVADWLR